MGLAPSTIGSGDDTGLLYSGEEYKQLVLSSDP